MSGILGTVMMLYANNGKVQYLKCSTSLGSHIRRINVEWITILRIQGTGRQICKVWLGVDAKDVIQVWPFIVVVCSTFICYNNSQNDIHRYRDSQVAGRVSKVCLRIQAKQVVGYWHLILSYLKLLTENICAHCVHF